MSFENGNGWESHKQCYLPTVKIKDYNVVIDGRKLFHQPIKNDVKTYDKIREIATGQGDLYTSRCLLDYPYFKKYFKLITIDLRKQQKLNADPNPIKS